MNKRVVVALGGNAILQKGQDGTYQDQQSSVDQSVDKLSSFLKDDNYEIVLTHGNGPQVGALLIQHSAGANRVPAQPMFICGAMSQGQIGFMFQHSVKNLFRKEKIEKEVSTIVTQVLVDKEDDAFKNPTKPVGVFYSKEEANKLKEKTEFTFKEDSGRGYRRVVPSPKPIDIIEVNSIKDIIDDGKLAIACGGGGIPVLEKGNRLEGVDAVIDKDKASALLGQMVAADMLIILTAVDKVHLNFGTDKAEPIDEMNVKQAMTYLEEGHFAEGSMKPKVEAVIEFVKNGDEKEALITDIEHLSVALCGEGGTWIRK
jgi:carbamate kinase